MDECQTAPVARAAGVIRIAVFASGTGSNFRNLVLCSRAGQLGCGQVVCLLSDRPDSGAVLYAKEQGIPQFARTQRDLGGRRAWETSALAFLREQDVSLIVLAGYMRLVGTTLLEAYPGRMINIHPSLLPAFPGLDAPGQALAAGAAQTGVTVHYVDAGMDTGPVIEQRGVPILAGDTQETLTARIHEMEHALLPEVIRRVCTTDEHD